MWLLYLSRRARRFATRLSAEFDRFAFGPVPNDNVLTALDKVASHPIAHDAQPCALKNVTRRQHTYVPKKAFQQLQKESMRESIQRVVVACAISGTFCGVDSHMNTDCINYKPIIRCHVVMCTFHAAPCCCSSTIYLDVPYNRQ